MVRNLKRKRYLLAALTGGLVISASVGVCFPMVRAAGKTEVLLTGEMLPARPNIMEGLTAGIGEEILRMMEEPARVTVNQSDKKEIEETKNEVSSGAAEDSSKKSVNDASGQEMEEEQEKAEQVEADSFFPEQENENPAEEISGFDELGMPKVEDYLNIRIEPSEEAEIAGHLNKGSGCEIIEEEEEWTKIRSGEIEGYVKNEYLLTGTEASKEAEEFAQEVAVIQADTLNVRKKASQDSKVISQVDEGETISCLSVDDGWAEVEIDDTKGYVSADYISVEKTLEKAVSAEETGGAGEQLVSAACSYIGNPYVWGGTSLTDGIDCSGFTMQLYAAYGIDLPHYSGAQAECGREISVDELLPGDLIFYADGEGTINHVSIYMGDGMVVHAKNSREGITTTDMYYRSPVKMIRLF